MAILAPPCGLNPLPKRHEFDNFGIGLDGHYNDAFSFLLACVGLEMKIFANLAFYANLAWPMRS